MENCILTVPIHLKMTLTAREAAEYSNIGIQQDRQYAESAQLPLRLVRWDKKAGKAPGV